jgi:cyclase
MPTTDQGLPTSEHFALDGIAEGVYAAIATRTGGAYSNAGIIDLGDQTLVFDAFMTPQAAQDLRAAAEQLTGRPVSYVVISHAHSDHWCGNQAFEAQTSIITTHAIREAMPEAAEWLEHLRANPSEWEEEMRKERERLQTEGDSRWRASLEASIARMSHLHKALPTLEFRLPEQTFDGKLVFHGTWRTAELLTQGSGHTDSDAYLVLPQERIMFMGDLGFFARTAQIEAMERSDIETFVPGHGPLGTKEDLSLQNRYIAWIQEMVARVIEGGGSVEDALQQAAPPPFDDWLAGGMARFEANVHTLYERLTG